MTVFSLKIDDETTEEFKNKREDDHYHEFIKFTSNDFDETSLKKSSPFTNYFQNLLKKQPELNLSTNDSINEYYSTDMFSIIVEYLYILPLWSWIMKDLWIRLNPQSNLQDLHSLTNNNVENWFDQLKNGLLQGKTSMPSIYATKVYNTVEAKYESYYKNERIVLNQNKKKILNEVWKPKLQMKQKRNKGYYYKDAPNFNDDEFSDGYIEDANLDEAECSSQYKCFN